MNQKFKRVLALLLTLCMVVSMCPAFALTAKAATEATLIKTEEKTTAPADEENGTWVQVGGPVNKLDASKCPTLGLSTHSHTGDCYYKSCTHKDGHISSCYSTATSYALCESPDTHGHTGTVTVADVVKIDIKKLSVDWDNEHPAYSVVYAAYKTAYDEAYANAKYLKEVAGVKAGAAAVFDKTYCFTVSASATPDKCTHGDCTAVGGTCYTKICGLPDHPEHTTDCYSDFYTWNLYQDYNDNSIPDEDETYTIVYKNGTDVVSETSGLEYGAETPKAPAIEKDYYNLSWSPAVADTIVAPNSGNTITYTAVWTPKNDNNGNGEADEEELYTVTWKMSENETLETDGDVAYGITPEYNGETPAKEATDQYTYTFSGWDPEIAAVTGDATYTATFSETVNKYTVTWKNEDGTVLDTDEVPYGDMPSYTGETPTKVDPENKVQYTFSGWDSPIAMVTGNVVYTATYSDEDVYTVKHEVNGGVAIADSYVLKSAETYTAPVATRQYYKLEGWYTDEALTVAFDGKVTADMTLYAKWSPITDENGDEIADEEQANTLQVVGNNMTYVVTVNGEETTATSIAVADEVEITITPAEGYAVTEVAANVENVSDAKATVKFTAGAAQEYVVTVATKAIGIVLFEGKSVVVNEYTDAVTEKTLFDLVYDQENSYPVLTAEEADVTYLAFSYEFNGKTYEYWADPATEVSLSSVLAKLNLSYLESVISKVISSEDLPHNFGEKAEESVKVSGNDLTATTTVAIIDSRTPVTVNLKENVSVTYSETLTEEAVYTAIFDSLSVEEGEAPVAVFGENMTMEGLRLNAGTYTVTVKFAGDATFADAEAQVEVTINKANASISVESAQVQYGTSVNVSSLIDIDPSAAECIEFAVGLSLGANVSADAGAIAYVNVPVIVDLDSIENETLKGMVQNVLNTLSSGSTFTVSELKNALEKIVSGMESLDGVIDLGSLGINLDTQSINLLISALETVEDLEGINNLTVKLLMNESIVLSDAGAYIVGGVISDANYNSDTAMNYLLITPNGKKVELAWNETDTNGFYTIEAINNGAHDFGAHISEVLEGDEIEAAAQIETVFMGIDINGNTTMFTDSKELTIGTYTQIAYIADLGNEMYYAEPLVRQVTVISDLVSVEFVDANDNNIRTFENDGNPHAMEAVATHRDGIALDQNNLTYRIYGMESDGDLYEGTFSHAEILSGNVGPKNTGAYTVIATYRDSAIPEYIGIGVGALIINPKPAAISVNDMIRPYEASRSDSLMSLIQKDPADAKMAVMVAGITNIGDFSEDGLAAVEGTVYIDLPQRVEDAINTIKGNELVTVDNFKALLAPLAGALEATGMDISAVQAFYDELAALPGTLNVQIADLTDYQFNKIGAYVVVAGIMDNDYYPAVDSGLVVIHPEIEEYTLGWNHADTNGILTRISLDSKVDLKASAQNAEGALVEDAAIKYLVYGFEKDGAEVKLTGTDEDIEGKINALRDGVYTQVAYIETEIDAEMVIAMAINRQLILMTESVTVEAPNQEYVYGEEIDYVSKITVSDPYNNHEFTAEELAENLTVKFAGINGTEIGYYSEEVPSNAGSYAVFAQYKQEENGDIKYFGIGLGTLTIKPAALNYDIVDSYHKYDGTQKAPEVKKPVTGIHDILFIVDTQNASVNVIAPSLGQDSNNWDGDLHIQYWLDELNTILANQNINKDELISKLDALISKLAELGIVEEDVLDNLLAVLEQIDSDLLTLNKALPVGKEKSVCKYNVYGIAFKDMNHAIEVAEGVLTIGDGYPICFQPGDANGMIKSGTTVFVDDVAYVLDENCVAWADDKDRELAIGYVYRNSGNHTTDHAYSDTTKNMYIWDLQWNEETNSYKADRVEELDNLLSFAGGSIWLGSNGVNGIRTYYATTADTEAVKGAFRNLGYEVVTHGVVVGWADKLNGSEPVPNGNNSASGHAAGNGAYYDEIYPAADKYITPDLRARFYVELKNVETSETKIIYSGSVERSIGYIAYQNIDIVAAQYQPYVKAILDKAAAAGFTYGGK